eukprot:7071990-Prymnesium_polylepis.1
MQLVGLYKTNCNQATVSGSTNDCVSVVRSCSDTELSERRCAVFDPVVRSLSASSSVNTKWQMQDFDNWHWVSNTSR